jgi:hypothetical protein
MAFAIPSNSAVDTLMRLADKGDLEAKKRLAQLEADSARFDLEDYRTVNTDRGPVRGYEGGGARRRL